MREPNLHMAPMKIDSYLKKYKFAKRFKGFNSTYFLKFCTVIKHLTHFRATNLKLLLSTRVLCASHIKFVRKYKPTWIRNIWIFEFLSAKTIYVNQKLHSLSHFALRAISNLFSFFYTPCISLFSTFVQHTSIPDV